MGAVVYYYDSYEVRLSIQFKQVHGSFLSRVVWSLGRLQRFWWEFSFFLTCCTPVPMTSSIAKKLNHSQSQLFVDYLFQWKEKFKKNWRNWKSRILSCPVETPTDWCAPIVAVPKPNGKVRLHRLHETQWECALRDLPTAYNWSTTSPTGRCYSVH